MLTPRELKLKLEAILDQTYLNAIIGALADICDDNAAMEANDTQREFWEKDRDLLSEICSQLNF